MYQPTNKYTTEEDEPIYFTQKKISKTPHSKKLKNNFAQDIKTEFNKP